MTLNRLSSHTVTEGVTTTSDGTPLTMLNRNRNVSGSSPVLFYHTPSNVSTSGATQLRFGRFGSGKSAIEDRREENEIVLKPNTKYYAKVTARTNGIYITHNVLGYLCECGL